MIKTIVKRLKLPDTFAAEEGYADVLKAFDTKPYPSIEGLRNMQRLLAMQNPRLNDINPVDLLDITLMRKLEESGFLAQLQSRYRE
jgi:hypothetical protein